MTGRKKKKKPKKKQVKKESVPIEIGAEKRIAIEAPKEIKKLEAPPIAIPPKDKNQKLKIMLGAIVIIAALAVGAYLLLQPTEVKLDTGTEINGATFIDILTKSNDVYIVMDIRGTTDQNVRRSIMQCGTDFTGSFILATGKPITAYSFDENGCIALEGTYTTSKCIQDLKNGTTIYIHPGSEPKYYTKMMKVGIGSNYTTGQCSINLK